MLLRNSISNTKKFFSRTIQSFKSFFSGGSYQKMPKTSPYSEMNNVQTSFNNKELDNFYTDVSHRWENDKGKPKKRNKKKIIPPQSTSAKQENENELNGSFLKFSKTNPVKAYQIQKTENYKYSNYKNRAMGFQGAGKTRLQENSSNYSTRDQERSFLVAQKLKELEMMDISNVDHVLDIEEVLHYYSRLTCPVYLDIVDTFFMEMYADFLGQPGTPASVNSRPIRLSSIRS